MPVSSIDIQHSQAFIRCTIYPFQNELNPPVMWLCKPIMVRDSRRWEMRPLLWDRGIRAETMSLTVAPSELRGLQLSGPQSLKSVSYPIVLIALFHTVGIIILWNLFSAEVPRIGFSLTYWLCDMKLTNLNHIPWVTRNCQYIIQHMYVQPPKLFTPLALILKYSLPQSWREWNWRFWSHCTGWCSGSESELDNTGVSNYWSS